ncbi:MAG: NUDIX domain-containing protein [Pseudomonadota bacterium]
MPKKSAGLLVHRPGPNGPEVFLVHPGGPFWAKKDDGAWSIPKGEFTDGEDALEAAKREWEEETGAPVAMALAGTFEALGAIRQAGGKIVHAWHVGGDLDPSQLRSGLFSMEWPPGSGTSREFPEVDRAAWFPLDGARVKILKGQLPLLDELERKLCGFG